MLAGTTTAGDALLRATDVPAVAAPLNCTAPPAPFVPPITVVGSIEKFAIAPGLTVINAEAEVPLQVARRVKVVVVETAGGVSANLAVL
jgi:hypothetical protein